MKLVVPRLLVRAEAPRQDRQPRGAARGATTSSSPLGEEEDLLDQRQSPPMLRFAPPFILLFVVTRAVPWWGPAGVGVGVPCAGGGRSLHAGQMDGMPTGRGSARLAHRSHVGGGASSGDARSPPRGRDALRRRSRRRVRGSRFLVMAQRGESRYLPRKPAARGGHGARSRQRAALVGPQPKRQRLPSRREGAARAQGGAVKKGRRTRSGRRRWHGCGRRSGTQNTRASVATAVACHEEHEALTRQPMTLTINY